MPGVGVFVRLFLAHGGSIISPDERNFLKLCMYIYIQTYKYYRFLGELFKDICYYLLLLLSFLTP